MCVFSGILVIAFQMPIMVAKVSVAISITDSVSCAGDLLTVSVIHVSCTLAH